MKKVWKGAAAAIAALSLGATGFIGATSAYALEDGKATITINNYDSNHTYKIYQLMTGDVTTTDPEVITNANWGTGAKKTGSVSTDDLNTIAGYATAQAQGTQATIAKAIIDNYVGVGEGDADKGQLFTTDPQMNLDPGYYVLIDQSSRLDSGDSKALPIIALLHAGEAFQINEKHDTVTAIKKVKENVKDITAPTTTTGVESKVDEDYNDTADYNIGDDVEYEFIASIPENIDKYDYYKYTFTDTLSKGLQLNNTTEKPIQVFVGDSTTALTTNYKVTVTTPYSGTADSAFEIDFGTFGEDGNQTATSKGLKDVPGVLDNGGKRQADFIKIKFSAELTDKAVVTTQGGNDGNLNTMKLTYSSNPQDKNASASTPDDSVIVFTYKLDFTKVDGTDATKKLGGAQFVIKNSDGKYAKADSNGKLSGWLDTKPAAVTPTENDQADYRAQGVFISNTDGTFGIQGLDDGTYTLEEIKAPEGYSLPTNPEQTFVIAGTLGTDGKGLQNWAGTTNALTEVKLNNVAWASQSITNSKQSSLPETGGMGTTMLYVAGGAIVLIAGIGMAVALRRRQA